MSTPSRAPGRPRSAEADAAIVRATLELLREEGFQALSVEAVRQRAGVGKATIYRRFPDKEALVRAAMDAAGPDLGEIPDTGSLKGDLLTALLRVYASVLDRQTATFVPRLLAESAADPDLHALFRRVLIDPRRAAVRRMLERAVARGELAADADLELVIDMIAGPIIYRLLIDGGVVEGLAERIDAQLDAVIRGHAPR